MHKRNILSNKFFERLIFTVLLLSLVENYTQNNKLKYTMTVC